MTTWNITLTSEMDEFVEAHLQSGQYADASEVISAGLRALEREETEEAAKLQAIRAALIEGEQSGIAPDGVFDRARAYLKQLAAETRARTWYGNLSPLRRENHRLRSVCLYYSGHWEGKRVRNVPKGLVLGREIAFPRPFARKTRTSIDPSEIDSEPDKLTPSLRMHWKGIQPFPGGLIHGVSWRVSRALTTSKIVCW